MNVLPDEIIADLAYAYAEGLSLRGAANRCGVNRETVMRYFRHFAGDDTTPSAEPSEAPDRFLELAKMLNDPAVIYLIDAEIARIDAIRSELLALRMMAIRRHGH